MEEKKTGKRFFVCFQTQIFLQFYSRKTLLIFRSFSPRKCKLFSFRQITNKINSIFDWNLQESFRVFCFSLSLSLCLNIFAFSMTFMYFVFEQKQQLKHSTENSHWHVRQLN